MLKSFRFPVFLVGLMAVFMMFAVVPLVEAVPPVNDACGAATAVAMSPAFSDIVLSTQEATSEASPFATCNVDPTFKNQHSVWYVWTAPTADQVEVNTYGSNYDTVVAVWSGACGSLVEVACNDDAHFSYQSKVTLTPVAGTTYYIEVMGYDDLEFGSLNLVVQPVGTVSLCELPSDPQLVSSSTNDQSESSINAAGEVVWVEYNPSNNYDQIMSNKRGALVTDAGFHYSPSINGLGDVVWSQVASGFEQIMKRSNAGAVTTVTTGNVHHSDPVINDNGEIVWAQFDATSGYDQIFSSTRGQLTSALSWHYTPAINNSGEVCWSQYDPATLETQIACLVGGMITTGVNEHYAPSINNAGTIVWSEVDAATGNTFIGSTLGAVTTGCPIGKHLDPTINNCGDTVFTNKFASGSQQVYVLGSGNSCLPNVTGVTPSSVSGVPTAIAISGSGFSGATAVKLSNGTALTSFSVVSDSSINATTVAGVPDGTYDIQVTTPNGTNQSSTGKLTIISCDPNSAGSVPTALTVTMSPASPGAVCASVVITAVATGGCKLEYSYQVYWNDASNPDLNWTYLGGATFLTSSSVTWDTTGYPAGTYSVRVFARNSNGNYKFGTGSLKTWTGSYVLNPGCSDPKPALSCDPNVSLPLTLTVGFAPNPPISVGTQDAITPTFTNGCVPEFSYQYYRLSPASSDLNYTYMGDVTWTSTAPYLWDTTGLTPGTYQIRVFARNLNGNTKFTSLKSFSTTSFEITAPPAPTVGLTATPANGQTVNWNQLFSPVDLTASPINFTPSTYTYDIKASSGNSWSQIVGCAQPGQGANQLCVWDPENYGQGAWDLRVTASNGTDQASATVSSYSLVKNPPTVTVSANPVSPKVMPYGTITLTAGSQYLTNPQYYFEYKKAGDVSYTMICNWSSSVTCNWNANALPSGTYDIKVYASDSVPVQQAAGSLTYTLSP
ncbi:MAG: hypothetical protein HZA20_10005 [Nitrospirae bacterium]|nr:hypothetical protein [Nitrospirota bacterium]